MRIYLCGSESSGKSTIGRYIEKKYNLPRISEMARTVLAEREIGLEQLRINLDAVDSFQDEVLKRQIEKEKQLTGSYVSDRSLDILIYVCKFSRNFSKTLNSNEFKEYVETLKKPDSIIFFLRPSKETMKQDGVRENLMWEKVIESDAMTKMLLEMHDLRYFQINTVNMQERVRFVDSVISLIKQ